MTKSALAPCPFCGDPASDKGTVRYSAAFAKEQEWGQSTFYFCNCPRCGVSNQGLRGYETKAEAVAAWNRRALSSERDELVERCARIAEGWKMYAEPRNDYDLGIDYAASQITEAIRALFTSPVVG